MSRNAKRRLSTVGALAAVSLVGVLPAQAHNAGHMILPDGTCQEVGSFRAAPLVGTDKTALDLMPATPQDEYGASFAAFRGETPLLPGGCPR
jgi:hypothetical protein